MRCHALIFALALVVAVPAGGCFRQPKSPRVLDHFDPVIKIPAMKIQAEAGDRSAIPYLVENLDDEDPAVRFYAITALEELTGQTLGYRYYDDELERRSAVDAWRDWLSERRAAATRPAGEPAAESSPPSASSR